MCPPPEPAPADIEEQLDLLFRGVDYGDAQLALAMRGELAARLAEAQRAGRPLTVYVGVDPTGSDLTLGHTVPLRKLRQFQDLGHHVIFVVGSFTARIGDPSDKEAARRRLTEDEVRAHAADYVKQVGRVLDLDRLEVRYNGDWLAPLTFADLIDLASHFTVSQFLQRDNFRGRFERGEAIWLHEFFYALMQAYDALILQTDVQIGGTEQLFNLMAGRKLQEARGERPQIPITLPILVGLDGTLRMSKSTGNYVAVADTPEDQYGKTMSVPDAAMENWFTLATSLTPAEIAQVLEGVHAGSLHPMEAKKILAREIVTLFHGPEAAAAAEAHFARTVQGGLEPEEVQEVVLSAPTGLLSFLTAHDLASSNSEARRLVAQGGVRIDGVAVTDAATVLEPGPMRMLQVGKRHYLRLSPRAPLPKSARTP